MDYDDHSGAFFSMEFANRPLLWDGENKLVPNLELVPDLGSCPDQGPTLDLSPTYVHFGILWLQWHISFHRHIMGKIKIGFNFSFIAGFLEIFAE